MDASQEDERRLFLLLLPSVLAAAAPQPAPPAAIWTVETTGGTVRTIIASVKTGGRLVADGFVDDDEAIRSEKRALAGSRAPIGSCARASDARPFTRLRRFAADGRLLWTWRPLTKEQALRLMGGWPGDCLSSDGGRLLVVSYRFSPGRPVSELGGAVIAVDRRPGFVDARGARTGKGLGDLRKLSGIGWKRGADATLALVVYDLETGKETPDQVVLGGHDTSIHRRVGPATQHHDTRHLRQHPIPTRKHEPSASPAPFPHVPPPPGCPAFVLSSRNAP